ncbi:probable F-box protein At2g36090 [Amaranthus tricolor]|uniref:probable F-box protein At2g36090 n=1 Tax=Amaranthus tricolor TaxID=29722 RepID=UPI002588F670|nr:probable F-box protein At2g36090 [Amaranthus tricolor]XP_057538845.1 probable F-box protein At2g36090 [Amaranthus tricolor]
MSVQVESICPLGSDIFYDILRRLDGATLASAACTCAAFSSISKEEQIWENVCSSLWPSTNRDDVKNLIRSIGGFRKFYADCYPLIVNKDLALVPLDFFLEYPEEWPEADYFEDFEEYESSAPSDVVSLVDITYNEKPIFSKVLWGISESDTLNRWFYNSPFHVNLSNSDVSDNMEKVIISDADGLPPIESLDNERKERKLWTELQDRLRLSWIVVNRKVNRAANVSSLIPLGVQRHWPDDKDFLVRFGSVLPAEDILPCQVVECILVVKFRMFNNTDSGRVNLELTQVNMQLEDMEGFHVNGRNSLMVLKKALSCRKSRNYSEVLESCNLYSRVRSEIKEEKMRNESRVDKMCILSGIVAIVTFWFCIL